MPHAHPPRPAPHVLTLDAVGGGSLPLNVLRIRPDGPLPPPGPLVSTFFMVFVITAGSGRARHSEDIDIHAGDVYLIPAGVEHQPVDMADLEGWAVGFDPVLLRSLEPSRLPGRPRVRGGAKPIPERSLFLRGFLRLRPGPARAQRIQRHVAEMEAELREASFGWENAAHAWLVLLVSDLLRELQEHAPLAPPTSSGLVRDALIFIEARCLEPLSLQDVAAAVGRTPSHLANAVRRETGLTVGDWLREHRMVEARRLLLGLDASVERVADRVGYADVTHFIRLPACPRQDAPRLAGGAPSHGELTRAAPAPAHRVPACGVRPRAGWPFLRLVTNPVMGSFAKRLRIARAKPFRPVKNFPPTTGS